MKDYNSKGAPKAPKGGKLMKNHGNTQPIKDDQKYDMGRMQLLGHEKKGNNDKAFEYKY